MFYKFLELLPCLGQNSGKPFVIRGEKMKYIGHFFKNTPFFPFSGAPHTLCLDTESGKSYKISLS